MQFNKQTLFYQWRTIIFAMGKYEQADFHGMRAPISDNKTVICIQQHIGDRS